MFSGFIGSLFLANVLMLTLSLFTLGSILVVGSLISRVVRSLLSVTSLLEIVIIVIAIVVAFFVVMVMVVVVIVTTFSGSGLVFRFLGTLGNNVPAFVVNGVGVSVSSVFVFIFMLNLFTFILRSLVVGSVTTVSGTVVIRSATSLTFSTFATLVLVSFTFLVFSGLSLTTRVVSSWVVLLVVLLFTSVFLIFFTFNNGGFTFNVLLFGSSVFSGFVLLFSVFVVSMVFVVLFFMMSMVFVLFVLFLSFFVVDVVMVVNMVVVMNVFVRLVGFILMLGLGGFFNSFVINLGVSFSLFFVSNLRSLSVEAFGSNDLNNLSLESGVRSSKVAVQFSDGVRNSVGTNVIENTREEDSEIGVAVELESVLTGKE